MDRVLAVFVCFEGNIEGSRAFSGEPAVCADIACYASAYAQVHRGGCSTYTGVSAEAGLHGRRQAACESGGNALCGGCESDRGAGECRIEMDTAVWEWKSRLSLLQPTDASDRVVAIQLQHHDRVRRPVFPAGGAVVYGWVEISPSLEPLSG